MSQHHEAEKITSPCVKVCTIDGQSGYCLGCGRTLGEISRWREVNTFERKKICTQLPERLAMLRVREKKDMPD